MDIDDIKFTPEDDEEENPFLNFIKQMVFRSISSETVGRYIEESLQRNLSPEHVAYLKKYAFNTFDYEKMNLIDFKATPDATRELLQDTLQHLEALTNKLAIHSIEEQEEFHAQDRKDPSDVRDFILHTDLTITLINSLALLKNLKDLIS